MGLESMSPAELWPSFTLYRNPTDLGVTMTVQEYGDVDFYDRENRALVTMSAAQFEMFKELHDKHKPKEATNG